MKLEKIKLSGFKSFVDATTIPITGNLTGIVGPNGCGKSNIIDAVRWVMGESSAKHLRGGNMADVIFNGSSTRKPVGTASVELLFDNSEGKAGGEYSKYSSISIKRQVNRDGQSLYMLNGARCRRRDITDLFLGTGLGARSYAIIEQGTISRLVEAKPDELRGYIEEAAGISKYKERRQETETRMRHTRENLERLDDLREEVEKQCKHLQKQAKKAEQYTKLKGEERRFKLELLAMRWNTYHQSSLALQEQLQDAAAAHNRLFQQLRELDSEINAKRQEYKQRQERLNSVQGDYYNAVAECSRLEQAIEHNRRSEQETTLEIQRLRQQAEQSLLDLAGDEEQLEQTRQAAVDTEQALQEARSSESRFLEVQQDCHEKRLQWQEQWEALRNAMAQLKERSEVQCSTITQLENQNRQLQVRMQRLQTERSGLEDDQLQLQLETLQQDIAGIQERRAELHLQLEDLQQRITELRGQVRESHDLLHEQRSELHGIEGKITSLELLQQHAMGKDNKQLGLWLEQMQLADRPRLAELLDVQSGWETAVETVLDAHLEAICVDSADAVIADLQTLVDESLILFETECGHAPQRSGVLPRLLDKIHSRCQLAALLGGVYCAENMQQARQYSGQLQDHESIVTPEGDWLGPGWLRIVRATDSKTGILQREKQLRTLKHSRAELRERILQAEAQLADAEKALREAEAGHDEMRQQDKLLAAEFAAMNSRFSAQTARHEQQQRRLAQIDEELTDIGQAIKDNAGQLEEAALLRDQAGSALAELEIRQHELEESNRELQGEQLQADQQLQQARQQVHTLQARIESLQASENLLRKQQDRLQQQHRQALDRITDLEQKLQRSAQPMQAEEQQLQQHQESKRQLQGLLTKAREEQEAIESGLATLSDEHARVQREMEKQKALLDKIRFQQQESDVRQQTVVEQLEEIDVDAEQVLTDLPEDADEQQWKQRVEQLSRQIERLGTINLTAIEEYQAQAERMEFLNEQHQDLLTSLNALDQAISRIDKESRQRFKETFDKINAGLQEKFPRLFGGGQAYLDLTDHDLLEAGVNIIARPPGKRNSSIHLLSGGEKALTAVALVFSIFELNPAPFCLLDEVDAPLDDSNVGRFSKMVEEMSQTVQFLYISHNKITMEIAQQLAGVTMKEAGVSRMVSVDIEEAINLAEADG